MDRRELQLRLIYSAIVAGKTYQFAERVTRRIAQWCGLEELPFDAIRRLDQQGTLGDALRRARSGSYGRLQRCLPELTRLDPATCTVEQLERVHGIGPKTARFFVLWTRPGERYAALDVHILRWLAEQGHRAPAQTPGSHKAYRRLERVFLREADKRGMTPRELDHAIWCERAGHPEAELMESTP